MPPAIRRRLQEGGCRRDRARVAVEAAVELGWERYIGLEGRFVGMHDFGASGKIADVYKKFDITAEAVVRAAHQTLAGLPLSEIARTTKIMTPAVVSPAAAGLVDRVSIGWWRHKCVSEASENGALVR